MKTRFFFGATTTAATKYLNKKSTFFRGAVGGQRFCLEMSTFLHSIRQLQLCSACRFPKNVACIDFQHSLSRVSLNYLSLPSSATDFQLLSPRLSSAGPIFLDIPWSGDKTLPEWTWGVKTFLRLSPWIWHDKNKIPCLWKPSTTVSLNIKAKKGSFIIIDGITTKQTLLFTWFLTFPNSHSYF